MESIMSSIDVGELLYEYTVQLTGMTDYGIALDALMSGQVAPPPEGARFDVPFEGTATGPRLKGRVTGVDHLRVRADGRFELHLHARFETNDGARVALFADGVAIPREGSSIADLRENVTLTTSFKEYAWVNRLQVWASGTVDLATLIVRLRGYAA
jgi:hypothetical protein